MCKPNWLTVKELAESSDCCGFHGEEGNSHTKIRQLGFKLRDKSERTGQIFAHMWNGSHLVDRIAKRLSRRPTALNFPARDLRPKIRTPGHTLLKMLGFNTQDEQICTVDMGSEYEENQPILLSPAST